MEARGTPSDPEYMINSAIPQDEWDRWNADRDRLLERTQSYRYVNPDIVGAEDLDTYGRWNNDPQYGNVWVPNVDPGWAPYREGRWVDEPYYGWTWVSADPWGWAPYHYGNWYMSSFGWAWYPGPIYGRHYWRPALVGFFGWGSGFSVGIGFGFGNVGWVPLAPYERYRPWYGRGFNNRGNSIIVNNVSVVNNYRNARFVNGRNGVTSINANDFGRRSINTNNFVRASSNDLVRTGSVQGRLPFNASAESRRMSDRQVNTQSLPRVSSNTRFSQRPVQGQSVQGQSVQRGPAQGSSGGFRRFDNGTVPNDNRGQRSVQGAPQLQGNPTPQVNRGQVDRGSNGNGSGWRRFDTGAPNNSGNGNRGQFNPGQVNPNQANPSQVNRGPVDRGQFDRGQFDRGNSNGGGRRFEPPPQSAPAPQVRSYPQPQQQAAPQPQEQRQFRQSMPQQQPVRISPPIVRERGPAPQASRQESPRGGFGTARPQGGGEQRGNGGGGNGGGGNRGESRGNGNGGNHGGGHDHRR